VKYPKKVWLVFHTKACSMEFFCCGRTPCFHTTEQSKETVSECNKDFNRACTRRQYALARKEGK
jgi:hypothetical protein